MRVQFLTVWIVCGFDELFDVFDLFSSSKLFLRVIVNILVTIK